MTTWDYDTEPTFASRWLTVADEDPQVAELREVNNRLATQLAAALQLVQEKNARICELEKAGWDVLPTLELYWRGERPIPATHVTGALRAVLEAR